MDTDSAYPNHWRRIATAGGAIALLIGLVVLLGWVFDIGTLKRVSDAHPSMKANSAVALMMLGVAILLLREPVRGRRGLIANVLAALAATYALVVLLEYVFGSFGFDTVIAPDSGRFPGRPSPHSAVSLLFISLGVTLVDGERARKQSEAAILLGGATVVAAMIGYAYRVDYLRGVGGGSGMALYTAIALGAASVGAIALRPNRGVVLFLRGDDPGATLARTLLPAVILVPMIGFAGNEAWIHGWLKHDVATSLVTLGTMGLLIGLTWIAAERLRALSQVRDDIESFTDALIDSMGEAVVAGDNQLNITRFNRAAREIFGPLDPEVPPEQWAEHYMLGYADTGDEVPLEELPLMRALAGERLRDLELVIAYKTGAERFVSANAEPIRGADGQLLGAVATVRDDTERRSAEARVRQLAAIVESSQDAIMSASLDGTVTSWNAAAERLFGFREDEIVGKPGSMMVPENRLIESQQVRLRVVGAERIDRFDTVRLRRDGTPIDVSLTISPIFDGQGRVNGISVIAHDISKRGRSERRFRRLLEMAPDAILGVDGKGVIRMANAQAEKMFGYSREELLGMETARLMPDALREQIAAERREYFSELDLNDELGPVFDVEVMRKNGTTFLCDVSLSTIESDEEPLMVAVVRDVTERNAIAEETERQKSEFFALVSHELRTPLTSIVGYADVLSEEEKDRLTEDGREFLEIIRRNTERLDGLVQDLLLVAQVDSGTFEIDIGKVDIAEVAREQIEEAAPAALQAELELTLETSPVPEFDGDQRRIGQVLNNLISNAIKFTPPGGEVAVRVHNANGNCMIEVTDDGIGIEPDEIDHLFDRFYRASAATRKHIKGVGLGLAITKAIVDQHHGSIEIKSEPGLGTTFRITLPLEHSDETHPNQPVTQQEVAQ